MTDSSTDEGDPAQGHSATPAEGADALFERGLQGLRGQGNPGDLVSAAVNIITASLTGRADARHFLAEVWPKVRHEPVPAVGPARSFWQRVFDRVNWPRLSITLGPFVPGHLDAIRRSHENDSGSGNSTWWRYETDPRAAIFKSGDHRSLLALVFDEPVAARASRVERVTIDGGSYAAHSVSLRDTALKSGFPVCWTPEPDKLKALATFVGMTNGRAWVREACVFDPLAECDRAGAAAPERLVAAAPARMRASVDRQSSWPRGA